MAKGARDESLDRHKVTDASKPAFGPISTIQDLYTGPTSGNAGRIATSGQILGLTDTGRHYYLGNQTSFVKLGAITYNSILDALSEKFESKSISI